MIKKNIIDLLMIQYNQNKEDFWKKVGPLVSFCKIYCEDIEKDKNIVTIEDLLEKNLFARKIVLLEINLFLKERLREIENLKIIDNEIKDFYKSYERAMDEKGVKKSDKNFADFIWFTKHIQTEKNTVILNILKDIKMVSVSFVSKKYEYKSFAIYKESDLYLKDINDMILKYKSNNKNNKNEKKVSFKIVKKED